MLIIHPLFQLLNIILLMYVFFLGTQRIRSLHFNQKVIFKWKRHVTLGAIADIILFGGILSGMAMVYINWKGVLLTGLHGKIGLSIGLLGLFSLGTGLYLNLKKERKPLLVMIHGFNNFLLVILVLSQIWTGWLVYSNFVLGY